MRPDRPGRGLQRQLHQRQAQLRALNLEINLLQDHCLASLNDKQAWHRLQALKQQRDQLAVRQFRQPPGGR